MKALFETPEELKFLHRLLSTEIMFSERAIDPAYYGQFPDHSEIVLQYRKKAFEFLEEPDPNHEYIELILTKLKSQQPEQPQ